MNFRCVLILICIMEFLIDSYISDEIILSIKSFFLCRFMYTPSSYVFWILGPYTFQTFPNNVEKRFNYYHYCPESVWSQNRNKISTQEERAHRMREWEKALFGQAFFIRYITINQKLQYANEN